MMYYPVPFRKARDEIFRVIGTERLPTFHDRPSLPYGMTYTLILKPYSCFSVVECILNETWRWGVPVPLSRQLHLKNHPRY